MRSIKHKKLGRTNIQSVLKFRYIQGSEDGQAYQLLEHLQNIYLLI
jgi:hypothetical protein